ncbi:protease inhibitor I42 family protein [Kitasatospora aureofaciens]|uniref:protease inhibitor I42 family protein n=1 Tax=Kitasatospora aureofaciens TaxID=1894 RepID=UPI001C43C568|nr:protease inhibitor I42 family protein [Kitasatospora aureofaciens]MBV6696817.1 protease inhibitor I42 family protein [Kitasatospora aureofaciens]
MTLKRTAPLALAMALLALAGCASTGTTLLATSSATVTAPAGVVLDEHANQTTLKVVAGSTIEVDLHSTYWPAPTSSAPDTVAPNGAPTTAPSPSCRPGGGCGTVTTHFTARTPGTAHLTATRTTCGEALNCPPDQRTYDVTVEVTG